MKNAMIVGIATAPANLFLTIFIVGLTMIAFGNLSGFAIIALMFFMWLSFMRFPIEFYSARMIKRRFIDSKTEESGKENDGVS